MSLFGNRPWAWGGILAVLLLCGCRRSDEAPRGAEQEPGAQRAALTAIADATVVATPPQGMEFATGWESHANRRATVYVAKRCGATACTSSYDVGGCGDTPGTACATLDAGLWQLVFLQQRFPTRAGYDVLEVLGDAQPYYVNHELRWDAFGTGTSANPRVIVGRTSSKGDRARLVARPHESIPVRDLSGIASGNLNAGFAFGSSSYWVLQDLLIDCENQARDTSKRAGVRVMKSEHPPLRPHHLVFKNLEITRCAQEAFELRGAEDVSIEGGRLYSNQGEEFDPDPAFNRYRRVDSNGVAIQAGSTRIRVKGVLSYLNSGDSVQCQGRLNATGAYSDNPSHILIQDNTFYGNLENAVDIKSCHHVNITGSNYFYGYMPSDDNGGTCHGAAILLHEETTQVLVEGARIADSGVGIAIGNEKFEVQDVVVRRNVITRMNQNERMGNLDGVKKFNCGDGILVHRGSRVDIYHNTLHELEHAGISVGVNTFYTGANSVRLWNNVISEARGLPYFVENSEPAVRTTDPKYLGGALHLRLSNAPGLYSQANLFYRSSGGVRLAKVDGSTGTQLTLAQWQQQMPTAVESQGNLDNPPTATSPGSQEANPLFHPDSVVPGPGSAAANSALADTGNAGTNQRCAGAPDKGAFESDCGEGVCATENAALSTESDLSDLSWGRQLRTCGGEEFKGVAIGLGGDIIASGYSQGSFGFTNQGGADAVLKRFSSSGVGGWTRQLGSSGNEGASAVATNAAGDIYIVGSTTGSLSGANQGGWDAFISKYSASGTRLWVRQLGTAGDDFFYSVAVDATTGHIYAVGHTRGDFQTPARLYNHSHALLAKYDAAGALLYTRQHGGTTEHGSDDWDYGYEDVALDAAGNVFATGLQTYNGTDGRGVYLRRFSPDGTSTVRQEYEFTQAVMGDAVAIDRNGSPWVAFTYDIAHGGCTPYGDCGVWPNTYAFVMRFNATTLAPELQSVEGAYPSYLGLFRALDIRFDSADRLLAVGRGNKTRILIGLQDFTVQRFTTNLTTTDPGLATRAEWSQWGGTNALCDWEGDIAHGLALDAGGNPLVVGSTCGPMFSETDTATRRHSGQRDALLMKFIPTP